MRETFGIPREFHPIGAVTIGHPDEPARDLRARRKSTAEVVHEGRWTR